MMMSMEINRSSLSDDDQVNEEEIELVSPLRRRSRMYRIIKRMRTPLWKETSLLSSDSFRCFKFQLIIQVIFHFISWYNQIPINEICNQMISLIFSISEP